MSGWHFADGMTGHEKAHRAATTTKYGVYTFVFIFSCLAVFAIANLLLTRVHSMKSILAFRRLAEAGVEDSNTVYKDSTKSPDKIEQKKSRNYSASAHKDSHQNHDHFHSHSSGSASHSALQPMPAVREYMGVSPHTRNLIDLSEPPHSSNATPSTPTSIIKSASNSSTVKLYSNEYYASRSSSSSSASSSTIQHDDDDEDHVNHSDNDLDGYAEDDFHDHNDHQHRHIDNTSHLESVVPPPAPTLSLPRSLSFNLPPPKPFISEKVDKYIFTYSKALPSRAVKLPLVPILIFWSAVFLAFILSETQQEFTYLAKRLGRVPVALLPATYFLTLRPSPLPQTFYLQLVPFHKWLGRIVFIMLVVHGIVYLYIYSNTGKLRKLSNMSNVSGIVAFFLFVLIVLTSLKPLRRRYYNNVFFPIHYISTWIVLPLIYYHSPKTTAPYVYLCGAILIMQMGYRFYLSRQEVQLPVQFISSSMLFVALPRDKLPKSLQGYFSPGSHVRVSSSPCISSRVSSLFSHSQRPANSLLPTTNFRSQGPRPNGTLMSSLVQSTHPYTVASLPQDPTLLLCIRKTRFPIRMRRAYTVTGPFASIPSPFFDDVQHGRVKRVLFVAGGTGIAFCAPLMRHLRSMNIPVKLLWAVRDQKDAKVLVHLGLAQAALEDRQVEIYITRGYRTRATAAKKTHGFITYGNASGAGSNTASATNESTSLLISSSPTSSMLGNRLRGYGSTDSKSNASDNDDTDEDDEDHHQQELRAASGFQGMFTPQTDDDRLMVTIDDTWCDGGERPYLIKRLSEPNEPGYVDEMGHISSSADNHGPSSFAATTNGASIQEYDEESTIEGPSSRGLQSASVRTASAPPSLTRTSTPQPPLTTKNVNGRLPIFKRLAPAPQPGATSSATPKTFGKARHNPDLDLDFTPIMINSRPVLNLRLKSWLHGIAVDDNSCCCVDQLLQVDKATIMGTSAGRWILASGGETLVGETEKWSSENGFSFYKDEFSL